MTPTLHDHRDRPEPIDSKPHWVTPGLATFGLATLGSLMLAGCGGGGSSSGVVNAPPPAPTYPAAPTTTPTPAPASASPGITVLAGGNYDASNPNGGFVDGTGTSATFSSPTTIALDPAGNLYVNSDYDEVSVNDLEPVMRKITPQGVVSTLKGFRMTYTFAIDGQGTFFGFGTFGQYLSATLGILKVPASGQPGVFVPDANTAGGSTDGPLAGATFYDPQGFAIDATGNIYVADSYNCTIRKIGANSVVSTLAGKAGSCGHADGNGSAASFGAIGAITIDPAGNLYVTDTGGITTGTGENATYTPSYGAVRKITPAGVVTTLAGSANVGTVDGTGIAARFYEPGAITSDAAGNVYVVDSNDANGLVRKVSPAGVVTTVVGQANAIPGNFTPAAPLSGERFPAIAWGGNGVLYAIQSNQILKVQFAQ